MKQIELVVYINSITEGALSKNSKTKKKIIADFDVASYSNTIGFDTRILHKPSNKLVTFDNIAGFIQDNVHEEDYLLVKGNLYEVDSTENLFLPSSVQIMDKKRNKYKCTDTHNSERISECLV